MDWGRVLIRAGFRKKIKKGGIMEDKNEHRSGTVVSCVHVLDGTAKAWSRNQAGDCVCDDCIEACMNNTIDMDLLVAVCPDCLEKSLRLAEYTDNNTGKDA